MWWPHAKCVMNTSWERNCDDSSNAGDHNFDSPINRKFLKVEGNPEKEERICVGNACESHVKWNASGRTSTDIKKCCKMYLRLQHEHLVK